MGNLHENTGVKLGTFGGVKRPLTLIFCIVLMACLHRPYGTLEFLMDLFPHAEARG
jgi:hypothetical protein